MADTDGGCQCRLFLYGAGAECRPTVQWWIQMVGVSVACSSIELVPSVIEPIVQWWLQMVGVSVACSSIELVPTVIKHTVPWWIQMVGCQCRLFLY